MKHSNEIQINSFMKSLGFSHNETALYLKLLESGISNIADLTKKTKIPRTTVVRNVEKLVEKGLISKGFESNETILIAENPSKIKLLIQENEIKTESLLLKYKELNKNLPYVEKYINDLLPKRESSEKVALRYYEGIKGVKGAYNLVINSKPDKIFTFLNADNYFTVFPETHDLFKKFLKKSINTSIYEIIVSSNKSVSSKLKHAINDIGVRCQCRFGSSKIVLSNLDFLVYDDTALMIHINEELPVGILIKSAAIANGLKAMHQMLWEHLPEILN